MKVLAQTDMQHVTGAGWQDISCEFGTGGINCSATAADIFHGAQAALGTLNGWGESLGIWLYDQLNERPSEPPQQKAK